MYNTASTRSCSERTSDFRIHAWPSVTDRPTKNSELFRLPQTSSNPTNSFGTKGSENLGGFCPIAVLPINPSLLIRNALKYLHRRKSCINFAKIEQEIAQQGLQISQFFWPGNWQIWTYHSEIWQNRHLSKFNTGAAAPGNWHTFQQETHHEMRIPVNPNMTWRDVHRLMFIYLYLSKTSIDVSLNLTSQSIHYTVQ